MLARAPSRDAGEVHEALDVERAELGRRLSDRPQHPRRNIGGPNRTGARRVKARILEGVQPPSKRCLVLAHNRWNSSLGGSHPSKRKATIKGVSAKPLPGKGGTFHIA